MPPNTRKAAASDYEVLVGSHDSHGTRASPCADNRIVPRVPLAIDLDPEMLEAVVCLLARRHRPFPDPAREDQCVEPAQHRCEYADVLAQHIAGEFDSRNVPGSSWRTPADASRTVRRRSPRPTPSTTLDAVRVSSS